MGPRRDLALTGALTALSFNAWHEARHPWGRASAIEDLATLLAGSDHQASVSELVRALAAYAQIGSTRDVARARARLRGLGHRQRHRTGKRRSVSGWESLTDTEIKVADLVAQGLTNLEVARSMFLSRHTVGFHLRQIFRKLNVRSRVELTRLTIEAHARCGVTPRRAATARGPA